LIEIFASLVVVWQLTGVRRNREQRALQLIGLAFLALTVYLLGQLVVTLVAHIHPAPSPLGLVWLAATVAAMLSLAYGKHRTGKQLGNPVLTKEAKVTLVDAYLALAVLVGLALNALLGWWWADPMAGLVIIGYGLREGWEALRG
jgi:divalent metal cation (Fe/Co/Zn/Cd) transporter